MKSIVTMILICCSALMANANVNESSAARAKKIDSLVQEYFFNKYHEQKAGLFENLPTNRPGRPPHCDPHNPPGSDTQCIDVMCEKLGRFGCDEASEVAAVGAACRGVDSSCVQSTCEKLGRFGCDELSELQSVGNVCRSVFDSRCMDVMCEKLGRFGCDEMSEISQVGSMCRGRIDSGCVESVCNRLGRFGCDEMSELQQVARTCGGN